MCRVRRESRRIGSPSAKCCRQCTLLGLRGSQPLLVARDKIGQPHPQQRCERRIAGHSLRILPRQGQQRISRLHQTGDSRITGRKPLLNISLQRTRGSALLLITRLTAAAMASRACRALAARAHGNSISSLLPCGQVTQNKLHRSIAVPRRSKDANRAPKRRSDRALCSKGIAKIRRLGTPAWVPIPAGGDATSPQQPRVIEALDASKQRDLASHQ